LFKDKNSKLYRVYQYEDGHILDLAAGNGDAKMVQLLLDFNMTVGPSAMAHAAHRNHTAVMEVSKGQHTWLSVLLTRLRCDGVGNDSLLRTTASKLDCRWGPAELPCQESCQDFQPGSYVVCFA
jgi:hypothetical protein